MKNICRYTLFIGLQLILTEPAFAQPLDTLLKIAMQQNPELAALQEEHLAERTFAVQVRQLPDPELGVGAFALPVETRLGPQWLRLSATQALPWPGTLAARERVALAQARLSGEAVSMRRLELSFELAQAYWNWQELRGRRRILTRNREWLAGLEKLVLSRVEAGEATLADVLQVQLRQQALEAEIDRLAVQSRKPQATLNQLLNRPPAASLAASDSLAPPVLFFDSAAVEPGDHPELRTLAAKREMARQRLSLNELDRKPSFALGLDYILVGRRSDAFPSGNGRDILSPRVGLKLPFFRRKYAAKAEEEERRLAALEHRESGTRLRLQASFERALADFDDAERRRQLFAQQIATVNAAINILQDQYSSSGDGFDALLRLYLERSDYELQRWRALIDGYLAVAEAQRYLTN